MDMLLATILILALVLLVLSLAEASMNALGLVGLKVLAEKDEGNRILRLASQNRDQLAVPLQFGIQLTQISIAVLVTAAVYRRDFESSPATPLLVMVAVVFLFRQFIPRVSSHSHPERIFTAMLPILGAFYLLLRPISMPLMAGLRLSESLQTRAEDSEADEEASEEEIEAYLDVGEEEGIFEEEETELIQSVVEFGDTIVREVMTPRTSIVAVSEQATLEDLKRVMVESRHSRIPVYRDRIDQVIGIAYVRQLLAHFERAGSDHPVKDIVQKPCFVPQNKKISDLLREFQQSGEHMALVVDEFGALAGLVTLEDLLEEIVGEIRDEDQQLRTDVVEEADAYLIKGSTEVSQIEELFDLELSDQDSNTISGLIVNHLGHVPKAGDEFELGRLKFHISNSDRLKIQAVRVLKSDLEKARKAVGSGH